MDQENNRGKKIVVSIITLILLSIAVFGGGMLVGKMSTHKKSKMGSNKTTNTVNNQKEYITDDQLYSLYASMDYSNEIKTTQFDTYHIATYEGEDYYVIDDDYKGEYYLKIFDLYFDFEDEERKSDEELKEFNVKEVMDYSKYSAYCEKWNLEKKYNDEKMNYIVYSGSSYGVPSIKVRLSEVEYINDIAKLYIWYDEDGDTDNYGAFVIIIPTYEKVSKIEKQYLYTQGSLNYYISLKKYGDDYNGKYNVEPTDEKPIIYLYPEKETDVSVELGYSDKITCSYPNYNDGWNVLAKPNGDLIDLKTNKNLYALYYESEMVKGFNIKNEGFIVKGEETSEFLEEKLAKLGLTDREAEEFIIYWLPRLEQNEYNYIRFATEEEINNNMPLTINPQPDSLIRIMMVFKGLDEPIEVAEQVLKTPERSGFIAVEWGGTEIK